MKFVLEIASDEGAFQEPNRRQEISAILKQLARNLKTGDVLPAGRWDTLYDINGNRCGSWRVE